MLKRIINNFLVFVLCFLLIIGDSAFAFADDLQENYLKDMAEGLTERYALAIELGNPNSADDAYIIYQQLFACELNRLVKYKDVKFQNAKFDMFAKAYIEGCEIQEASLKYIKDRYDLFNNLNTAGSRQRTMIIVDLYDYYGLDLPADIINLFRTQLAQINGSNILGNIAANTTKVEEDNPLIEIVGGEYRIDSATATLSFYVTVKNISDMPLYSMDITLNLLDADKNIVDEQVAFSNAVVEPGQSITMDLFLFGKDDFQAISISRYDCNSKDGHNYWGYISDSSIFVKE